ncbi:BMP family ABC transporter substrate-binding protein [[Mycoplasma] gypis]|uniref:BMP family ABC transporter substrate-binding protein n=1 Tax=[Mycoplasma] gypis TaxID=92404 RepID=A0ABZ2RQS4_9BACT|nr:BMP family ABC transporter substrate-binding protein [[Mycoplasma] gypis]MBN0919400.1 BMP family ABC transporter substrate-binding protein [[Mycoplasma] gypis]
MSKKQRLFLSLGILSAPILAIPFVAASCGETNKEEPKTPVNGGSDGSTTGGNTTNTGGNSTTTGGNTSSTTSSGTQNSSSELLAKIDKRMPVNASLAELIKSKQAIVITDAGHIDDKSFNQSAWEGLKTFAKDSSVAENEINNYKIEPSSESDYDKYYSNLLQRNEVKYWITVGFKHESPIKEFFSEEENRQKLINSDKVIIAIDYDASAPLSNDVQGLPQGHAISLLFNTKESGYVAGKSAAEYVSTVMEPNEVSKRLLNSFGGGAFPGVTDFIEGYLKGINDWNKANPDKKVKHKVSSDASKINLSTGFNRDNQMATNVTKEVATDPKPLVILPVAGPATLDVSEKVRDRQLIIGVDVDQVNSVIQAKDKFFTSITKEIGQALYDILRGLYTNDAQFLYGFQLGTKSISHKGSLKEGWTGLAKAHLSGDETARAQAILDKNIAEFKGFSEDKVGYINSDKALENGQVINDIVTRLNKLVEEINK